jgi:hypothetical protein
VTPVAAPYCSRALCQTATMRWPTVITEPIVSSHSATSSA